MYADDPQAEPPRASGTVYRSNARDLPE
jgi:hypothetical protein